MSANAWSFGGCVKTVLLIGKGPTALAALDSLAERLRVVGILRDVRLRTAEDDELQRRADELEVPIFTDITLHGVEQTIIKLRPDCTVLSGYDRILPAQILELSRFVNVHGSPLPKYRGRTYINWAIINNEPELAVTIHVITEGLDAGNVLYQKKVAIDPHDKAIDVFSKLNEIQRQVLGDTVERYLSGYTGIPQDESAATYVCARVPEDGEINWSYSTDRIYALIRALSPPFPEAYTYLETRRISIIRAVPVENAPRYAGRIPGRVVVRSNNNGYVDVLSGDGVIRIYEVRTADSVRHPAAALIRSTRQTLGLRTEDLLKRIEVLSSQIDQLLRRETS